MTSEARVLAIAHAVWEEGPSALNNGALRLDGLLRVIKGLSADLFNKGTSRFHIHNLANEAEDCGSVLSCGPPRTRPDGTPEATVLGAYASPNLTVVEYHALSPHGHIQNRCGAVTIALDPHCAVAEIGVLQDGSSQLNERIVTRAWRIAALAMAATAFKRLAQAPANTDPFGYGSAAAYLRQVHNTIEPREIFMTTQLRRTADDLLDPLTVEDAEGQGQAAS